MEFIKVREQTMGTWGLCQGTVLELYYTWRSRKSCREERMESR